MGRITKSVITAGAMAGAVSFAQLPEFSQQYIQRIGGAVDELTTVVADFDRDAAASDLERRQALARMNTSDDTLVRDRGTTMTRTISRYESLTAQQEQVKTAEPVLRPVVVATDADPQLLQSTWEDFRPAVPVTRDGLVWLAIGAFFGWAFMGLLTRPMKRRKNVGPEKFVRL